MEFVTGFMVGCAVMVIFLIQYSKYATKKAINNNKEAVQQRIDEINLSAGLAPEEDKEHV